MASTENHGGQQDMKTSKKHNFLIRTPIEVIFVSLESSPSTEQL
jgi:hypothetical protein